MENKIHLDRFKALKLREKSTQFFYFSDDMLNIIKSDKETSQWFDDWSTNKNLSNLDKVDFDTLKSKISMIGEADQSPETPKKKEPDVSLVPGTLVLVVDYGSGEEPRKYMWNKSKGEILKKNPDGTFKIRVTDVKDSNVLFSKKWFDQEQKALTQKLNLPREAFQTLKEIEDKENAEAQEAEQAKAQAEKDKASEKKVKEVEKAKKEKEKAEKKVKKEESVKATFRRLL